MAIVPLPMIDNLTLNLEKDYANCIMHAEYDINWPKFDQITNLAYSEQVELVGVDPARTTVLAHWGIVGLSSNGDAKTHRTHNHTIAWSDLNEDPAGTDEIAVKVTLTPLLPVVVSRQSDVERAESP